MKKKKKSIIASLDLSISKAVFCAMIETKLPLLNSAVADLIKDKNALSCKICLKIVLIVKPIKLLILKLHIKLENKQLPNLTALLNNVQDGGKACKSLENVYLRVC